MIRIVFFLFVITNSSFARDQFGQLTDEDQKYFKSSMGQGKPTAQRLDDSVEQINKLWGEVYSLKDQVKKLQEELNQLKNQKKNK